MVVKIRLVPSRGCGAAPRFVLRPEQRLPKSVVVLEVTELLHRVNEWIESEWMGWGNWGWALLCPCLARFVSNDLLMRAPLVAQVELLNKLLLSSATVSVSRKVKTYGYGETSETVVKVRLVLVALGAGEADVARIATMRASREERNSSNRVGPSASAKVGDEKEALVELNPFA